MSLQSHDSEPLNQPADFSEGLPTAEKKTSMTLQWIGLDNFIEWARLNTPKREDPLEEMLQRLATDGSEEFKKNPTAQPNVLRIGEVIRLPKGFSYTQVDHRGVEDFTLNVETDFADFRVTHLHPGRYVIEAVDPKIQSYRYVNSLDITHFYSQISVPKFLVNAEQPNIPIQWRDLVVTE